MNKRFCDQCGASIKAEAKFCSTCGADVSSINIEQKEKAQPGSVVEKKDSPDVRKPKNDTNLVKKILIPILSIIGVVLIAGIIVISVFISRSCSSGNVISSIGDAVDSEVTSFDATAPGLAELVSPDQLAILSVDGPPQAYTIYIDPTSGSVIEQWSYYILGREINFIDGVYDGGVEVIFPDTVPDVPVPQVMVYPWEILKDFSPEAVIRETGTAIFNTSALVLPGWNDGYEVARLWLLSGGGNMVTVDGRLAMLDIDPGEALDLDQFTINDFLVGTLVGDNNRLGAILSPDSEAGSYRLSLSPRGQGTTGDGTGFIFELTGPDIEKTFVIGENAKVIISGIDGSEIIPEASGALVVEKYDDGYTLAINALINGREYILAGFMGSAVWRSDDSSTTKAIGDVPEFISDNPELISEDTELIVVAEDESEDETVEISEPDWVLTFSDNFDSNENGWPVSYGEENEDVFYQSDIFQDQYLVFVQQKKEGEYFVERLIPKELGQTFSVNIDVVQEEAGSSGGGLALSDKNGVNQIYFLVFAYGGYFWIVQRDSSGLKYPLDYPVSEIKSAGQINTLSIMRAGPDFYFFINSKAVGAVTIEDFVIESLGVVVNSGPEEQVTCYFDKLEVYDLR